MGLNFLETLNSWRRGAASLCEGGGTIRLYPSIESQTVDDGLKKLLDNITATNGKIQSELTRIYRETAREVGETR